MSLAIAGWRFFVAATRRNGSVSIGPEAAFDLDLVATIVGTYQKRKPSVENSGTRLLPHQNAILENTTTSHYAEHSPHRTTRYKN